MILFSLFLFLIYACSCVGAVVFLAFVFACNEYGVCLCISVSLFCSVTVAAIHIFAFHLLYVYSTVFHYLYNFSMFVCRFALHQALLHRLTSWLTGGCLSVWYRWPFFIGVTYSILFNSFYFDRCRSNQINHLFGFS